MRIPNVRCQYFNGDGYEWVHTLGTGCPRGRDCFYAHPPDSTWPTAKYTRPKPYMRVEDYEQPWERRRSASNVPSRSRSPHHRSRSRSPPRRRRRSERSPSPPESTHTERHDSPSILQEEPRGHPQSNEASEAPVVSTTPALVDSHGTVLDPRLRRKSSLSIAVGQPLSISSNAPPSSSTENPLPYVQEPEASTSAMAPSNVQASTNSAHGRPAVNEERKREKMIKLVGKFNEMISQQTQIQELEKSLSHMRLVHRTMGKRAAPLDVKGKGSSSAERVRASLAERIRKTENDREDRKKTFRTSINEIAPYSHYFPSGRRPDALGGGHVPIQAQITHLQDDITNLNGILHRAVDLREAHRNAPDAMEIDRAANEEPAAATTEKLEQLWSELESAQERVKEAMGTHESEKIEFMTQMEDRFAHLEQELESTDKVKDKLDALQTVFDESKNTIDVLTAAVTGLRNQRDHAQSQLVEVTAVNEDLRSRMDQVVSTAENVVVSFEAERMQLEAFQMAVTAFASEPLPSAFSPDVMDHAVNGAIERLSPRLQEVERICRQMLVDHPVDPHDLKKTIEDTLRGIETLSAFAKLEATRTTGVNGKAQNIVQQAALS